MNGEVPTISAFEYMEGKTKVAILMTAQGSVFAVFRKFSNGVKSLSILSALGIELFALRSQKTTKQD